jgi:hypothetical protein
MCAAPFLQNIILEEVVLTQAPALGTMFSLGPHVPSHNPDGGLTEGRRANAAARRVLVDGAAGVGCGAGDLPGGRRCDADDACGGWPRGAQRVVCDAELRSTPVSPLISWQRGQRGPAGDLGHGDVP